LSPALIASAWAIGVGILVLSGWFLDNETLKRVVPGLVAMNPVTALLFIACGTSLGLLTRPGLSRRGRVIANILAACVALVGLLKLAGVMTGWDSGIDRLLFAPQLETTIAGQLPNRMAPNTALNFLLLGAALLRIDAPARGRWGVRGGEWWPCQWFAILAACASLLAIIGYAYGARYLYGVGSFIPMAVHTALTFAMLLMGVLYARPTRGIMEIVTSYSAGGAMARRLLPAAILLPAVLGWLRFSHVQNRVNIWLDPMAYYDQSPGSGQIVESMFGMGWGGLVGRGFGSGLPQRIPYAESDFIVGAIGEELGLTGVIAVILLYGIIVERALRAALVCRDGFGKLIAVGLAGVLALQVFVVIGGVTRLIPLTGLTTPFLSYGGSSLVANWVIVALLLRVSDYARRPVPVLTSDEDADAETTQVVKL